MTASRPHGGHIRNLCISVSTSTKPLSISQCINSSEAALNGSHLLQVTANQLAQQKESEQQHQASAAQEAAKARKRMVSEEQYSQLVEGENLNRDDDAVEARSVTAAISALKLDEQSAGDAHPERYKLLRACNCSYCHLQLLAAGDWACCSHCSHAGRQMMHSMTVIAKS